MNTAAASCVEHLYSFPVQVGNKINICIFQALGKSNCLNFGLIHFHMLEYGVTLISQVAWL